MGNTGGVTSTGKDDALLPHQDRVGKAHPLHVHSATRWRFQQSGEMGMRNKGIGRKGLAHLSLFTDYKLHVEIL
jgi:hypothetical protein